MSGASTAVIILFTDLVDSTRLLEWSTADLRADETSS